LLERILSEKMAGKYEKTIVPVLECEKKNYNRSEIFFCTGVSSGKCNWKYLDATMPASVDK